MSTPNETEQQIQAIAAELRRLLRLADAGQLDGPSLRRAEALAAELRRRREERETARLYRQRRPGE